MKSVCQQGTCWRILLLLLFCGIGRGTIGPQHYSGAKFGEGRQACAVIYQNCLLFSASGPGSDFVKDMDKRN